MESVDRSSDSITRTQIDMNLDDSKSLTASQPDALQTVPSKHDMLIEVGGCRHPDSAAPNLSDDDDDEDDDDEEDDEPKGGKGTGSRTAPSDNRTQMVAMWLLSEYEPHEGTSLPRSVLYDRYLRECPCDPVNAATFGKIIRAVFPALRTRRLGTRGNSKYHYYGIRVRPCGEDGSRPSPISLENLPVLLTNVRRRQKADRPDRYDRSDRSDAAIPEKRNASRRSSLKSNSCSNQAKLPKIVNMSLGSAAAPAGGSMGTPKILQPKAESPGWQPLVPNYEEFASYLEQICQPNPDNTPGTVSFEHIEAFAATYLQHIVQMLKLVSDRDFGSVETALSQFWRNIPKEIVACLHCDEAIRVVSLADDYLYQVAVSVLVGDVLETVPIYVTQSIRQFAKSLDSWMTQVFDPCTPLTLVDIKMEIARRFCRVLRRRTSLNHLAQAVRGILQNNDHRAQMIHDWSHVDFASIREQSMWIIKSKEPFLLYIEDSIKNYLCEGAPLANWTLWLESIIEQCIAVEMAAGETLDSASRSIILRWSFFSSMVMRDLTLRSANSFGSFHLIRLLFDEYILFYMEKKLDEHRRAVGMFSFWSMPPEMADHPPDYRQSEAEMAVGGAKHGGFDDQHRKNTYPFFGSHGSMSLSPEYSNERHDSPRATIEGQTAPGDAAGMVASYPMSPTKLAKNLNFIDYVERESGILMTANSAAALLPPPARTCESSLAAILNGLGACN